MKTIIYFFCVWFFHITLLFADAVTQNRNAIILRINALGARVQELQAEMSDAQYQGLPESARQQKVIELRRAQEEMAREQEVLRQTYQRAQERQTEEAVLSRSEQPFVGINNPLIEQSVRNLQREIQELKRERDRISPNTTEGQAQIRAYNDQIQAKERQLEEFRRQDFDQSNQNANPAERRRMQNTVEQDQNNRNQAERNYQTVCAPYWNGDLSKETECKNAEASFNQAKERADRSRWGLGSSKADCNSTNAQTTTYAEDGRALRHAACVGPDTTADNPQRLILRIQLECHLEYLRNKARYEWKTGCQQTGYGNKVCSAAELEYNERSFTFTSPMPDLPNPISCNI